MDYNYHVHTYRCGHASGTEEEYIKRAIDCGIKYMGFSDHFPFMYPDGFEDAYRVPTSTVPDYFNVIGELREKYKDVIEINIGFEMEYYPEFFDTMLKNAISYGTEYLILGQHFTKPEHYGGGHSISPTSDVELLKSYTDSVIEAIKTGVFTYVAHPDMFNFIGERDVYRAEVSRLCSVSKEYGVPLEINCLGIRDNRVYPNENFWQQVGRDGAPVTFGFDAHDILNAYDGESVKKAMELVSKYKLNYIGKPTLKKLN